MKKPAKTCQHRTLPWQPKIKMFYVILVECILLLFEVAVPVYCFCSSNPSSCCWCWWCCLQQMPSVIFLKCSNSPFITLETSWFQNKKSTNRKFPMFHDPSKNSILVWKIASAKANKISPSSCFSYLPDPSASNHLLRMVSWYLNIMRFGGDLTPQIIIWEYDWMPRGTNNQLMVNWWFGARWFGIRIGVPLRTIIPFIRGSNQNPKHLAPNHQALPLCNWNKPTEKSHPVLVGGFNPSEKY